MKILLADDHELIRKGLRQLIAAQLADAHVEEAATLPATMARLEQDGEISLVLLDLHLPGASGLDGMNSILSRFPDVAIVLLSSDDTPATIIQALRQGASGYIPKSTCNRVLLKVLELVIAGGVYLPPDIVRHGGSTPWDSLPVASASDTRSEVATLSGTQQRILELLARGMGNKDIAERTGLALQTVKNQVSRILHILQLDNRAAVAAYLNRQESSLPRY